MRQEIQESTDVATQLLARGAGLGAVLVAGSRTRPAIAAPEKINFQLDWIAYGRHAPYYTALDKGFYRKRGLDVSIAQGRGTLQGIRTLVAGQSQFIFQDIGVMLSVRAKEDARIKALACMYQRTPHTLFYMKNKGIAKPKDLEGKTIAFSPGNSPRLMFPAFAKANGIDKSKVKWLSVDPNSKNAVLLNGNVDGMVTYVFTLPVLQKAAKAGDEVGTFVYSDWGADFYSNGIGALEDYIKAKPDVTQEFRPGDDGRRGVYAGESQGSSFDPEEASASARRGSGAQGSRDPAQSDLVGVFQEAARQHDARNDGCHAGPHGQIPGPRQAHSG